jgi:transcription antitermination factor NusG
VAVAWQQDASEFERLQVLWSSHLNEIAMDGASDVRRLPWYALQVRSRKEDYVVSQLLGQGFESFLPKYKVLRHWSDRVKELEQPLFPGYLFCRFEFESRRPVIMTPGVLQVVGLGRTPMPVEEKEILSIQEALASGLHSEPWPYLQAGERVRVNYKYLSGLEGILVNFKGNHRVVLSVTLLQRSVALEVDPSWVIPVAEGRKNAAARATGHKPAIAPAAS